MKRIALALVLTMAGCGGGGDDSPAWCENFTYPTACPPDLARVPSMTVQAQTVDCPNADLHEVTDVPGFRAVSCSWYCATWGGVVGANLHRTWVQDGGGTWHLAEGAGDTYGGRPDWRCFGGPQPPGETW